MPIQDLRYIPERDLKALARELASKANRLIMVIGAADTGKTALVQTLANTLSRDFTVGIADLDMGQSHIGPPSTIAWGFAKNGFKRWEDIGVEDFYFTGSLSPAGSLLPAITGAKVIVEKARKKCEKAVIDTTGLISEPIGRLLKTYKFDILSPDLVIALEKKDELKDLLGGLIYQKKIKILKLPASNAARSKTAIRRTLYRALKFRSYFKGSRILSIDMKKTGVLFTAEKTFDPKTLKGRLISFRDVKNDDIALGIIENAYASGRLKIRTPLAKGKKASAIVIGRAGI